MANYGHIIFYSLIGGIFSLLGGIFMLGHKKTANILAEYATPFAAGALLGSVFLDLLPDGLESADPGQVLLATLIGVLVFFYAERFLRWFHHHHEDEGVDPSVKLIIAGDTIHNAMDGVAIAAAFLVSVPTGIVTTLAVAAHEIPQEIGDFGLMLAKGMRRSRVLLVNVCSALATIGMAVLTFAIGNEEALPIGFLLGISAGFLLYIAASDLIPTIHAKTSNKRLLEWQPILLLLGVGLVGLAVELAHKFVH